MIVWHSGEICKSNFSEKREVLKTAWLLVRRGEVVCALCSGALTVHGCYPRHCREEGGKRHYGWIAQGHCEACKVYPALLPSFIRPHKHYKADAIERVIENEEAGNNVEISVCAADASTMRRWVKAFKVRGEQAAACLFSKLPAEHNAHIGSLGVTLLQRLFRLLREYPLPEPERGGVIGNANIILTTRNCGFL